MAQQKSCLINAVTWLLLLSVVGITALSFATSHYGWSRYLELLSHFQLQYFVLSAIGLAGLGLTRRKPFFLLGLACTAALSTHIIPWYLPVNLSNPSNSDSFRVLISNVNNRNQAYEDVLTFVQQKHPDLALFIEVNDRWVDQLKPLLADLPYSYGKPSLSSTGILLLSRQPLLDMQLKSFSSDSTPSIVGTIQVNSQQLTVVGTHPLPPLRSEIFHSRNQQLDSMGQYLQAINTPKLVLGDLNLTMWSPYYKRLIRRTHLQNARRGFGLLPSWPTNSIYPPIPQWLLLPVSIPIDHCLLTPGITVTGMQVGPNVGSDHRPVVVDLRV